MRSHSRRVCNAPSFPSVVCVADELAREFAEGLRLVDEVPLELARLDAHLEAMSGIATFWFDDAPDWVTVRAAALEVVRAFGWSSDPPPPSRQIYVGT